jgi:hypothetical protein
MRSEDSSLWRVEKVAMMALKDIRDNHDIKNMIDWDMTPEEAVTLYLEWGNNWTHGKNLVRSKNDVSHYFVVNTWDAPPMIYLIRRNSEEAIELATIPMPERIEKGFLEWVGYNRGVYPLSDEVRTWLEGELYEDERTDNEMSQT